MKAFKNRVAVITCGASGIGRSLALNLTKRGVIVALADKNMAGLEETQKMVVELGGTASIRELDVSDHVAFAALADELVATYGQVHMLFRRCSITLLSPISRDQNLLKIILCVAFSKPSEIMGYIFRRYALHITYHPALEMSDRAIHGLDVINAPYHSIPSIY
jgi:NAD(P)-dependent dehydrogenase (short-subunit alcohol dehydrogenase family)